MPTLVLGAALQARADSTADFQEARRLFDQKQYQAAARAFEKLAAEGIQRPGAGGRYFSGRTIPGKAEAVERAVELARLDIDNRLDHVRDLASPDRWHRFGYVLNDWLYAHAYVIGPSHINLRYPVRHPQPRREAVRHRVWRSPPSGQSRRFWRR